MIEDTIIRIIKSLDRMSDNFDNLTLRRLLLIVYTMMLFTQSVITTLFWMFGKDISNGWLGILTIEHTSWAIMVSYYFKGRNEIDRIEGNGNGEK
jgi:hypothetical protein